MFWEACKLLYFLIVILSLKIGLAGYRNTSKYGSTRRPCAVSYSWTDLSKDNEKTMEYHSNGYPFSNQSPSASHVMFCFVLSHIINSLEAHCNISSSQLLVPQRPLQAPESLPSQSIPRFREETEISLGQERHSCVRRRFVKVQLEYQSPQYVSVTAGKKSGEQTSVYFWV